MSQKVGAVQDTKPRFIWTRCVLARLYIYCMLNEQTSRKATIANDLEIEESLLDYNFENTLVVLCRRFSRLLENNAIYFPHAGHQTSEGEYTGSELQGRIV
jgi:hypothetical protein